MPLLTHFAVTTHDQGTTCTVTAAGELDVSTADGLRAPLAAAVGGHAETVVLDLSGLTFLDSSGVHLVASAVRRAEALGRRFVVLPAPEPVQQVFALAGLEARLPFARELGDQARRAS